MKRILNAVLLLAGVLGIAATAPAQPNATWYQGPSWSFPLVPTNFTQSETNVWLPNLLYGNEPTTYWQYGAISTGNESLPAGTPIANYVDGELLDLASMPSVPPGSVHYNLNDGPYTIPGGRHTLSAVLDPDNEIQESDDGDNAWGRQFVWTPYELDTSGPVVWTAPPDPTGGWGDLAAPASAYNCVGFGFTSNPTWTAVTLRSLNLAADYDLRLFEVPAIRDESFVSAIAGSAVGAGHLDAVLVNRNQVGVTTYDVGVQRYSGDGNFAVEMIAGWFIGIGDVVAGAFDADEFFLMRQLEVGPGETGPLLLGADSVPGAQLRLAVFDASFSVGGLFDAADIVGSEPDGSLRLVYDFATPGSYAVVVYRDPIDYAGAQDFTWTVTDVVPDLAPAQLAGWHAPLTPRTSADAVPTSVALPAVLTAGSPTWFNHAVTNTGLDAVGGVRVSGWLDGEVAHPDYSFFTTHIDPLSPGGTLIGLNHSARVMPGGRHTLTYFVDSNDGIYEVDEMNNIWGEQYVWEPGVLSYGTQMSGIAGLPSFGGLSTVTSGEPLFTNKDGYRLPPGPGWWRLVSLAHDPDYDFDLTLHDPSTGSKDGFAAELRASTVGGTWIDYILVNDNLGPFGDFDVGVANFIGPVSDYVLDVQASTTNGDPTAAPLGPRTLGPDRLADVWDLWLEADVYSFQLDNLAGLVDWSLALHAGDQPYASMFHPMSGGYAWDNGPGVPENFSIAIAQPGWYGLVVSKLLTADAPLEGTYRLRIGRGGTAVDDVATAPAAIAEVSPNPFNPSTRIAFDLAAAGDVRLEVFDVQGALVRVLAAARFDSGRHEVAWDGRDADGRALPSGVYMARLRAGDVRDLRKLVLLK